jgi:uncharacterized membrane protein YsdA (DUF1294 family)
MQIHLLLLSLSMQITAAALALYALYYSPERVARREARRLREERLGERLRALFEDELQ